MSDSKITTTGEYDGFIRVTYSHAPQNMGGDGDQYTFHIRPLQSHLEVNGRRADSVKLTINGEIELAAFLNCIGEIAKEIDRRKASNRAPELIDEEKF
jgi:hypothetical protein